MESSSEENSIFGGHTEPLSEAEIGELSDALYALAVNGIAVPKDLLRNAHTGDIGTSRHYGHALDAIPPALDRLGADRETIVVGLLRRFEQTVRDHHDQVKNRSKGAALDREIMQRYFDVVYLVGAAKPKTEKSVIQVTNFLRSDKQEVHEKASEMLQGAPYFPVIIDRLIENVATHGIRQWPNRQSRALASFVYVAEVRLRLMNCFHSDEENLRNMAVMTFSCLKEDAGPEAESELFAIAESDENKLQSAALDGLRVITPRSSRLRQLALRLIHSDKYWVRGNAIACLEAFQDRDSRVALLSALLDEGGADFDNAGAAAKLLEKMPLDASEVLAPLMATLETLLEREDRLYGQRAGFRAEVQVLADVFKVAAEVRGETADSLGVLSYASPETLLAVARIFGRLGAAAHPAVLVIENCSMRPYVAGSSDGEEWRKILEAIRNGEDRSE